MSRWATFGPDPQFSTLPGPVQNCLKPGGASYLCDGIIGDMDSQIGFCGESQYARTTYCSCVNNSVPCPVYSMASCSNSALAYKPWAWYQAQPGGESQDTKCGKEPICVNVVEAEGTNNLVPGLNQQCGTIENITNIAKTNPIMAAIIMILVIILVITLVIHIDSAAKTETPAAFN